MAPVPGAHLGQLVSSSERITVSVGDDISVTPVIQPDGFSVAFHLVYAHTPQRDSDGASPNAAGVQRHLVEADVHIPSLELQEVSRFRVTLDSEEQGRGIPLLEDLPAAGVLFRPRRVTATTTQENIILVEAVIYPTVLSVAGKGWLALDATDTRLAAAQANHTELTDWVLQSLRRQSKPTSRRPTDCPKSLNRRPDHRAVESLPMPTPRWFRLRRASTALNRRGRVWGAIRRDEEKPPCRTRKSGRAATILPALPPVLAPAA